MICVSAAMATERHLSCQPFLSGRNLGLFFLSRMWCANIFSSCSCPCVAFA
ncbi:hypothetical protein SXCC_04116 [Gluconacetobacter sp. SXCC-1]|nr:hypothetical protein SXCC_04116 [Gluconacetobacter sp. SXCC-1]